MERISLEVMSCIPINIFYSLVKCMRILHIVEAWKGGIATYVYGLQEAQALQGHEVALAVDKQKFEQDVRCIAAKLEYYTSSRNPILALGLRNRINSIIEKIKPDLIYTHSSFPGLYSRLWSRHGMSVIHVPHAFSVAQTNIGWIQRSFYSYVERLLSKYCAKVLCMSVDEMRWASKIGIPAKKIALIRTGMPDNSKAPGLKRRVQPSSTLKVGFFSRNSYEKGFDFIQRAIPYMVGAIEIHIFGDRMPVSEDFSEGCVIQHGWIDQADVHDCMLDMDAVIVPSRWEGWCMTVVEAMRAGRTVIASNAASLPEMIIHRFNGIVLQCLEPEYIASTINNLDKEECLRMGRNARKVYEDSLTYDRYMKEIDALQEDVMMHGVRNFELSN